MSAEFVASVRARSKTLRIGTDGGWLIRVEVPDVWDVVRLEVPPTTPVRTVKGAALAELVSAGIDPDEFITKLNGAEVLDEDQPLAAVGVETGSVLLVTYRRRRPVR